MILTPVADVAAKISPRQGNLTKITFAGEKSDTANMQTLQQARDMEKAGATPREMWQQTGWMRGLDNQWRYEISDTGAGVNKDGKFYHPELEKAYPTLFNEWKFEVRTEDQDEYLAADPYTQGYSDPQTKTIVVRDTLSEEDQRSVFVHEFQHAVQYEEGFSSGGTPSSRQTANIAAVKAGKGWFGQLMSNFGVGVSESQKSSVYQSYGGEAEARATESRMYMNEQERKDTFPYQSYDVSPQTVKETERLRNK